MRDDRLRPALIDHRPQPNLNECGFYHALDLPGVGPKTLSWEWDLRDGIDRYLGGFDFEGKSVLEVGPASGFITATICRAGGDVISVELPEDVPWEFVPNVALDRESIERERITVMTALKNGFWYTHNALGLSSRVLYGSVSDLPDRLRFDVAVLAAVLLHVRDPLAMLAACAERTEEAIIVVERDFPELSATRGPVCRLVPSATNGVWHTWWDFSPVALVQFLEVLGFGEAVVTHHQQRHRSGMMPMFTVVARRSR